MFGILEFFEGMIDRRIQYIQNSIYHQIFDIILPNQIQDSQKQINNTHSFNTRL